jgi:hypothetical protein
VFRDLPSLPLLTRWGAPLVPLSKGLAVTIAILAVAALLGAVRGTPGFALVATLLHSSRGRRDTTSIGWRALARRASSG